MRRLGAVPRDSGAGAPRAAGAEGDVVGIGATRVELTGLVKTYSGARVVDDVDLVVEPGQLTALLGPSG